jgi:hypothetical protein
MEQRNNVALLELAKIWILDGDLMKCRACGLALVASRDGEPMRHHADGCRHREHEHPWRDLRNAMAE